jgi:hypothetical protein
MLGKREQKPLLLVSVCQTSVIRLPLPAGLNLVHTCYILPPNQSSELLLLLLVLFGPHLLLPLCLSCHSLMADLRARLGVRRLSDSGRFVMGDVLWLDIQAAIAMRSYLHRTYNSSTQQAAHNLLSGLPAANTICSPVHP